MERPLGENFFLAVESWRITLTFATKKFSGDTKALEREVLYKSRNQNEVGAGAAKANWQVLGISTEFKRMKVAVGMQVVVVCQMSIRCADEVATILKNYWTKKWAMKSTLLCAMVTTKKFDFAESLLEVTTAFRDVRPRADAIIFQGPELGMDLETWRKRMLHFGGIKDIMELYEGKIIVRWRDPEVTRSVAEQFNGRFFHLSEDKEDRNSYFPTDVKVVNFDHATSAVRVCDSVQKAYARLVRMNSTAPISARRPPTPLEIPINDLVVPIGRIGPYALGSSLISKTHCTFRRKDLWLSIQNHSSNGTLVNGVQLSAPTKDGKEGDGKEGETVVLQEGDVVNFVASKSRYFDSKSGFFLPYDENAFTYTVRYRNPPKDQPLAIMPIEDANDVTGDTNQLALEDGADADTKEWWNKNDDAAIEDDNAGDDDKNDDVAAWGEPANDDWNKETEDESKNNDWRKKDDKWEKKDDEWGKKDDKWSKKDDKWEQKDDKWEKKGDKWENKDDKWEKKDNEWGKKDDKWRKKDYDWEKKDYDWEKKDYDWEKKDDKWEKKDDKWEKKNDKWEKDDKWEKKDDKWEKKGYEWEKKDDRWEKKDDKWENKDDKWEKNDDKWEKKDDKWEEKDDKWEKKGDKWEKKDDKWGTKDDDWAKKDDKWGKKDDDWEKKDDKRNKKNENKEKEKGDDKAWGDKKNDGETWNDKGNDSEKWDEKKSGSRTWEEKKTGEATWSSKNNDEQSWGDKKDNDKSWGDNKAWSDEKEDAKASDEEKDDRKRGDKTENLERASASSDDWDTGDKKKKDEKENKRGDDEERMPTNKATTSVEEESKKGDKDGGASGAVGEKELRQSGEASPARSDDELKRTLVEGESEPNFALEVADTVEAEPDLTGDRAEKRFHSEEWTEPGAKKLHVSSDRVDDVDTYDVLLSARAPCPTPWDVPSASAWAPMSPSPTSANAVPPSGTGGTGTHTTSVNDIIDIGVEARIKRSLAPSADKKDAPDATKKKRKNVVTSHLERSMQGSDSEERVIEEEEAPSKKRKKSAPRLSDSDSDIPKAMSARSSADLSSRCGSSEGSADSPVHQKD